MAKEDISGSASGAFLHGAGAVAFQTLALPKDLADPTQCGRSYGEIDTGVEPGLGWAGATVGSSTGAPRSLGTKQDSTYSSHT